MKILIVIYFVAAAFWGAAHYTLELLALAGGAIATVGYFSRKLRHAWREVRDFMREGRMVWRIVLGTHDAPGVTDRLGLIDNRLKDGDKRFDTIEGKLDKVVDDLNGHEGGIQDRLGKIEGHIGVIADANEHRTIDALAGDPRSPVTRRRTDT